VGEKQGLNSGPIGGENKDRLIREDTWGKQLIRPGGWGKEKGEG